MVGTGRKSRPAKRDLWRLTGWTPHVSQDVVAASRARFKVVCAGARWGKSALAAREAWPEMFRPGSRGWVVAPTYELSHKVTQFFEPLIKLIGTEKGVFRSKDKLYQWHTPWGSWMEARPATNPDQNLVGEGLDWVIVSEASRIPREVWERYLRARLADRQGWAFIESVPGGGWFKDVFRRGQDPRHPDWESWQRPSWTSPTVPADEVEEARGTLRDAVFRSEWGAEFVAGVGQQDARPL